MSTKLRFGTKTRLDYRTGHHVVVRRTSMSYDRLMQVVNEQAMAHADFMREQAFYDRLRKISRGER
jgi:hypothetical protein